MRIIADAIRGRPDHIYPFWHRMGCETPVYMQMVCNGLSDRPRFAQACLCFDSIEARDCQIMADQEDDTESQSAKKRKRSGPRSRTSSYLGVTRVSPSPPLGLCRKSGGRCLDHLTTQYPHASRRH